MTLSSGLNLQLSYKPTTAARKILKMDKDYLGPYSRYRPISFWAAFLAESVAEFQSLPHPKPSENRDNRNRLLRASGDPQDTLCRRPPGAIREGYRWAPQAPQARAASDYGREWRAEPRSTELLIEEWANRNATDASNTQACPSHPSPCGKSALTIPLVKQRHL
jgi:hypothetical protein